MEEWEGDRERWSRESGVGSQKFKVQSQVVYTNKSQIFKMGFIRITSQELLDADFYKRPYFEL